MPILTDPTANSELMARALAHLDRTFLGGCTHSCARAAFCLACLARDEGYGEAVREACAWLSEILRDRAAMRSEGRAERAPWLVALPPRASGRAGA